MKQTRNKTQYLLQINEQSTKEDISHNIMLYAVVLKEI